MDSVKSFQYHPKILPSLLFNFAPIYDFLHFTHFKLQSSQSTLRKVDPFGGAQKPFIIFPLLIAKDQQFLNNTLLPTRLNNSKVWTPLQWGELYLWYRVIFLTVNKSQNKCFFRNTINVDTAHKNIVFYSFDILKS